MAAGNFEILDDSPLSIDFRQGTYLTQSAPLLPKTGTIRISPDGTGSNVKFEIGVTNFAKYWMIFVGVAFCWLIFPPILIHRALVHHPAQLMRNLMHAI